MAQPSIGVDPFQQIDWVETRERLILYAKRHLGRRASLQDAEDVAMEAIQRVLDPDYRNWDPSLCALLVHLGSEVNGILRNRRRTKKLSQHLSIDPMAPELRQKDAHDLQEQIITRDTLWVVLGLVSERGDANAETVLSLWVDGVCEAKDVAVKSGLTQSQVYEAKRRLREYHDEVVLRQMEESNA